MIEDRPVDFGYEYCWISCDHCADRIRMKSEEHLAGATASCNGCGEHMTTEDPHDLAVATVDDPATDVNAVAGLAWYHSSSFHKTWPPTSERPSDPAIHLGTYEAAVENMLRRMRNQGDVDTQFFLHRVQLAVDPEDIVPDVGQEKGNIVGTTEQAIVGEAGHRVRRYINRYEHIGSISLAVVPSVIAQVQTIAIPLPTLAAPAAAACQAEVDYIRTCGVIEARRPDTRGISGIDLLMPDSVRDPKVAAIARVAADCDHDMWAADSRYLDALTAAYLPGVGFRTRSRFIDAVCAIRECSATQRHERFRSLAALISDSFRVISAVAAAPTRIPAPVS